MWSYEKKLLHPVRISHPDLNIARLLFEPYAGEASSMTAAMTYFNQRYTMPSGALKALLTDIGTEMLAHMEMIASMIVQSIQGASPQELSVNGFGALFAAHGRSLLPANSQGRPWSAAYTVSSGDAQADISFDIALESRMSAQYARLISLSCDKGCTEPLEFLKQRCVVHRQRFAEAMEGLKEQKE
jgi:spore coat protein JC